MIKYMKPEEKEMMETAMFDTNPKHTQRMGEIAVSTLKEIFDIDVSRYSVLELTAVIDSMKAVRKAKLQRRLGIRA